MKAAVLLCAALFATLAASSEAHAAQDAGTACLGGTADSPPCGYITPVIDLDFPDKRRCPGMPGEVDADLCNPLPADGATVAFNGTVRWFWRESEDLTYPADTPIDITFGGATTNPSWLTFEFEPKSYQVTSADLFDPRNLKQDNSSGSPVVYFWFERPVTVTFTRTGGPTAAEMPRLESRDGIQSVVLKAKSTKSGEFYKESFGIEEFRYNATAFVAPPPIPVDSPLAPAPVVAVGLLVVAALRRGRRR